MAFVALYFPVTGKVTCPSGKFVEKVDGPLNSVNSETVSSAPSPKRTHFKIALARKDLR